MQYDMNGNIISNEINNSDRKFYGVPVIITSTVWESGIQLFEADSPEEALKKYEDGEMPHDTDYTGWQDQEYVTDELDDCGEIELIPNEQSDIQWILRREQEAKDVND